MTITASVKVRGRIAEGERWVTLAEVGLPWLLEKPVEGDVLWFTPGFFDLDASDDVAAAAPYVVHDVRVVVTLRSMRLLIEVVSEEDDHAKRMAEAVADFRERMARAACVREELRGA